MSKIDEMKDSLFRQGDSVHYEQWLSDLETTSYYKEWLVDLDQIIRKKFDSEEKYNEWVKQCNSAGGTDEKFDRKGSTHY